MCVSFGPLGPAEHSQEVQKSVLLWPSINHALRPEPDKGAEVPLSPAAELVVAHPGLPREQSLRTIADPALNISVLLS